MSVWAHVHWSVLFAHVAGIQTEATSKGENDIIFRHNIRLQTPKCDCDESESLKSLLYRINGLEEEVTYLKNQCTQGCCGGGSAIGELTEGSLSLATQQKQYRMFKIFGFQLSIYSKGVIEKILQEILYSQAIK